MDEAVTYPAEFQGLPLLPPSDAAAAAAAGPAEPDRLALVLAVEGSSQPLSQVSAEVRPPVGTRSSLASC